MTEEAPQIALLIGAAPQERNGLKRIPVALATRGFKGKQRYAVTAADLRNIVANYRKRHADVVVDYEHSTLALDGQPKPTAGWLKDIEDGPDAAGVLWGWVAYTEQGAASIAAQDYKYVSPVIEWSRRDKETGEQQGATLTSLALTKQPLFEKLPELPLLAASEGWEFGRGDVVDTKEKKVAIKRAVLAALAAGTVRLVADDGTESTLTIEGLKVVTMEDVKRGKDGKKWDFASLPHGEDTVVASDVVHAMAVQTKLDDAVKEGKITPAQYADYEPMATANLPAFERLVASMKPQVEMKALGTGATEGEREGSASSKVAMAVQARIAASDGKLDYGEAMRLVLRADSKLSESYKAELAGRE